MNAETRVFDAHGFAFVVASPLDGVTELFDELLADMAIDASEATTVHRLEVDAVCDAPAGEPDLLDVTLDGESVYPMLRPGSLMSHVLMEMNQQAVRSSRGRGLVPLHAAAVRGGHGTVLFPGASHSGKTTLATALAARHGDRVRFVADEVSALDPADLSIRVYGKPSALRTASVQLLAPFVARLRKPAGMFEEDERFVPPSALTSAQHVVAGAPRSAAPVSAVVFPRFDESLQRSDGPHLASLTPGEVLERLMQSVLGTGPINAATFNELARVAASAAGFDLRYAHLDDVLDELTMLT